MISVEVVALHSVRLVIVYLELELVTQLIIILDGSLTISQIFLSSGYVLVQELKDVEVASDVLIDRTLHSLIELHLVTTEGGLPWHVHAGIVVLDASEDQFLLVVLVFPPLFGLEDFAKEL